MSSPPEPPDSTAPPRQPRSRRRRRSGSGAETKAEILAAADALLRDHGPARVRLDAVAEAVGISRQAVLHHFGSRDGLMRAVVGRAWSELFAELRGLETGGQAPVHEVLDRVDEVARRRGNARVGAWLLLSGTQLPPEAIADQLTELPLQLAAPAVTAPRDEPAALRDARYTTLLMAAALFGDAIFGGRFREAFGMPDDEAARADFRAWLAARLSGGGQGA
jgi:AcrR family transcriptional regulator